MLTKLRQVIYFKQDFIMAKSPQKYNFAKAYRELEKIVSDFEAREIDLEKDLPKFERGMELAAELQKALKEMENKVVEVEKKFGGDD